MKQIQWTLCLIFLSTFSILPAQTQPEQVGIKTRLVFLGMKGQIREVGLWKNGKFAALRIPSSNFPEAIEYEGPNPLNLVTLVKNEAGEMIPVSVARATLPPDAEEVLLLMLPMPPKSAPATTSNDPSDASAPNPIQPPTRYGIKVVDFSPSAFPDSSFLLWNLTGRPLLGSVGDKVFKVTPHQFELIQPEINGKPKALDAKIMYADDTSRQSYTSRKWFLQPNQKFMMIMTANPEDPQQYLLKTVRY
ncbi:hypothetical protein P3T73_00650 [Kiritimatiellota bacterium B12222]|nr:hypothetical protein P3T73_00650 [Kiritimatiellota bacterium B12222]